MISKVRVHGWAMNRTALGIAHAYLKMYPHATLEDLNKAFPKEHLNTWAGADVMFADVKDKAKFKGGNKEWQGFEYYFFELPEEVLELQDGTKVCLFEKWDQTSFNKLVEHAQQYGIEIASFEPRKGFQKGGFKLEYLNGYVPPIPEKKTTKWWLWALLGLLALAVLLFLLLGRKAEPVVVEKIVEKEIIVKDTVYIQQLQEIEKNFNAAQFVAGKANLSQDAKFVLHDLAKLLKNNPELKLQIVGHTSKEGTEDFNQKLSEARAKAAVDFLVNERGIEASRLEYKGVGSSQPIDPNQLDINRRTEFIVISN